MDTPTKVKGSPRFPFETPNELKHTPILPFAAGRALLWIPGAVGRFLLSTCESSERTRCEGGFSRAVLLDAWMLVHHRYQLVAPCIPL